MIYVGDCIGIMVQNI